MKRTTPDVTASDSDPDMDEALRRVQSAPAPAVRRAVNSDRREVRNRINGFLGR